MEHRQEREEQAEEWEQLTKEGVDDSASCGLGSVRLMPSGLSLQRAAATVSGGEVITDEPVWIRVRSARIEDDAEHMRGPLLFRVMPSWKWQIVKLHLKKHWADFCDVPDAQIRLLWKSIELRDDMAVAEYDLGDAAEARPIEIQCLIIDSGSGASNISGADGSGGGKRAIGLSIDSQVFCPPGLKRLASDALLAMKTGVAPKLTDDGTGAAYMLQDASRRHVLAVFNPKDEEANAPNNPRNRVGEENSPSLRQGVLSTQQAAREVAAFILDHGRLAGVPETTLAHARHPKGFTGRVVWKVGAFQAFVETKDAAGNYAPQVFLTENVHNIGILDVRIVNLDRNDGNLLVKRTEGRERS